MPQTSPSAYREADYRTTPVSPADGESLLESTSRVLKLVISIVYTGVLLVIKTFCICFLILDATINCEYHIARTNALAALHLCCLWATFWRIIAINFPRLLFITGCYYAFIPIVWIVKTTTARSKQKPAPTPAEPSPVPHGHDVVDNPPPAQELCGRGEPVRALQTRASASASSDKAENSTTSCRGQTSRT